MIMLVILLYSNPVQIDDHWKFVQNKQLLGCLKEFATIYRRSRQQ